MKKEEFKAKANQTIDEVSARINELKAKKDSVRGDVQGKYEAKIEDLVAQKADLQSKYDDLMNASDEKWDEAQQAFSSAADSFKEGLSKIASLF